METLISSGGATVVESGSVFSYDDKPIEITLLDIKTNGVPFKLKFSFSYDTKDNSPRWIFGQDNSDMCIHIDLINFNNPLGTGMLSPFRFASNNLGVSYYITYMVNSWEQTRSKLFSYSIYCVDNSEEKREK